MAKKATRKLTVFQTRIGFFDIVIATGSRAAALRAWGTRQDLFAQGLARIVTDPEIIAAAVANPDALLRRPVGTDLPFGTEAPRPRIADVDPGFVVPSEGAPPVKPNPPPPDRSKLAAAEAELAALDQEHERQEAEFAAEQEAIRTEERRLAARKAAVDAEIRDERDVWRQRRAKAEKRVAREENAYRDAGGDA